MLDLLVYLIFRGAVGAINLLPLAARIKVISLLLRGVALMMPQQVRVAHRNLEQAFPGQPERQRQILNASYGSLARLIVDVLRTHTLDREWVREHVDSSGVPELVERVRREHPGRGVLYLGGHLGSFELQIFVWGYFCEPSGVIVRQFKMRRIGEWWKQVRQSSGHEVIFRGGAMKKMVAMLCNGQSCALPFDQNITRDKAVFVDWFGRPAATTRAVGLTLLASGSPVVMASMDYLGNDRYKVFAEQIPVHDILDDSALSEEQKIYQLTVRASEAYQRHIMRTPEAWFWMHRRWRTTPEGVEESFYR